MTRTEVERIAVVEEKVSHLVDDVAEIKRDVKTLVAASIVVKALPWAAIVTALVAFLK